MIALDRERYSGSKRNRGSVGFFDNLLMAKHYILETMLLTKTYGIIMTSCGASRSLMGAPGPKFFDVVLSKHINNLNGSYPIYVVSHGKNHLDPNNALYDEGNILFDGEYLKITSTKSFKLSFDVYLPKYVWYVCSWDKQTDSRIDHVDLICSDGTVLKIKNGKKIIFSDDATKCVVFINSKDIINIDVKIQLEMDIVKTSIEPHHSSTTIIPFKDSNGIFYNSQNVSKVDMKSGFFVINGIKKYFDNRTLITYANIIHFEKGYVTYKLNGIDYHSNKFDVINNLNEEYYKSIDYEWMIDNIKKGRIENFTENNNYDSKSLLQFALDHAKKSNYEYLDFYSENNGSVDLLKRDLSDGLNINFIEQFGPIKSYFDESWDLKDSKRDKNIALFATALAESGNRDMQARLGKCYRYGRGVEKDLPKAAGWMRKAADQGLNWARVDYFDILWESADPGTDKTMVAYAAALAESGNRDMQARLGKCYRYGRGVEKNNTYAEKWTSESLK